GPFVRRHRVHDAIRPDLARVLVEDGHARPDPRADDERLPRERAAHELGHRVGERGHDAREDGAVDEPMIHAAQREHLPNEHRILGGRARAGALAAHVMQERGPVEHAEARVRVPDVDDEEHRYLFLTSMMPSRTGSSTLSTRGSAVARALNAAIAFASS